jgi:broad specificity phosphatase PhoE
MTLQRRAAARILSWKQIALQLNRARNKLPVTSIWLVRHGETDLNVHNLISGQSDAHLTSKGKAQATQLRQQLPAPIDRVWSSPLIRAVETMAYALPPAQPYRLHVRHLDVADRKRIRTLLRSTLATNISSKRVAGACDIFFDARLSEISMGELEGKSRDYLGPYRQRDIDIAPPGGESYRSFARRVFSATCDALTKASATQESLAFFVHSGTVRVLASLIADLRFQQELFEVNVPNSGLVRLAVNKFSLPNFWLDDRIEV